MEQGAKSGGGYVGVISSHLLNLKLDATLKAAVHKAERKELFDLVTPEKYRGNDKSELPAERLESVVIVGDNSQAGKDERGRTVERIEWACERGLDVYVAFLSASPRNWSLNLKGASSLKATVSRTHRIVVCPGESGAADFSTFLKAVKARELPPNAVPWTGPEGEKVPGTER